FGSRTMLFYLFHDDLIYFFHFGSKASFNPSPKKLMDNIVNVIQTAGGIHIHSLFCSTSVCLASISIFPQLGISGGTPTPIKLSPASATIYVASNSVAWTIIVVITFGIKCFMITLDGFDPMEVAAKTYSFSFSANILLRTIRATLPQPSKLKTMIKLHIPVTLPKPIIIAFNTITKT